MIEDWHTNGEIGIMAAASIGSQGASATPARASDSLPA